MRGLFQFKRIYQVLLIPISFIIWKVIEDNPELVENIFLNNIYKVVSEGISRLTGVFPFSVGEICILFSIPLIIIIIFRFIRVLIVNRNDRINVINKAAINIICLFSIILFIYTVLCRVNYYRLPFSYYSGLTVEDSTVEELYGLCLSLVNKTNVLRDQMQEDSSGITKLTDRSIKDEFKEIAESSVLAYEKISSQYPILGGNYSGPKPLIFSKVLSAMETTGIFFTFTMEANINIDVIEYSIPSTICHELAHLRGFMREDEANYISYLVCSQSDDIRFQYSGNVDALLYSMNQLYNQDRILYYQIRDKYSDGLLRDLYANWKYWEPYQDKIMSKVADKVNDTYLKSNNQQQGVKSYGRMVDLLLAQYKVNMSETTLIE